MRLFRIFKPRLKSYMLDGESRIVEAFKFSGKTYYMFDDAFKVPSGRGLMAMVVYEEFRMKVNREYLELHIRAMDKILDDRKSISIQGIMRLNENLKERLNLALFPDHVYKLASVIFFDKDESPYSYDYQYNEKKIQQWKRSGGTLDFFLKTPLGDLIGYSNTRAEVVETFSQVAGQIDQIHQKNLQDILSSKG